MVLIILVILGLLSGIIASGKNRSFGKWFIYGFFLGLIAIIHALVIEGGKKCPECYSVINKEAKVCKFCKHKFPKQEVKEVKVIVKRESHFLRNVLIIIAIIVIIRILFAVNFFPPLRYWYL